jgi:hypothetical protein
MNRCAERHGLLQEGDPQPRFLARLSGIIIDRRNRQLVSSFRVFRRNNYNVELFARFSRRLLRAQ